MASSDLPEVLGSGDHASRPAATDVVVGATYACSDHGLEYQSDGATWSTRATYGTPGGYVAGGTDVAVADGGTGASTAGAARTNLGVEAAGVAAGLVATHEADTTAVHGITDTSALYRAGGTDVAVADGGTGSSTAAAARTALGLVIGTDVAGLTSGRVPVANLASGTPDGTKFIRDDGALAVPAGGGGGGSTAITGGSLVFLQEQVASDAATLDFTSFISSDYDEYEFHFVDIVPATNGANLYMRMGSGGGPTFDTGGNYSSASHEFRAGGAAAGGNETGGTAIQLQRNGSDSTSLYTFNGKIRLFNPQSAVNYKTIHGTFAAFSTYRIGGEVFGAWESATAMTAARFLFSSGNIASGKVRIYGVAKAVQGAVSVGPVLLEQHTADGTSTTLDFTACISSAYDEYRIEFVDVLPATNGVMAHLLVRGGGAVLTAANYQTALYTFINGGSATFGGSGGTLTSLSNASDFSNGAGNGIIGSATLFSPASADAKKVKIDIGWRESASTLPKATTGTLVYAAATVLDGFQFKFSSGNIASGTIRVYGIPKATAIAAVTDYVRGSNGSGALVIPGLAVPDRVPASPSAYDDDFDTTDTTDPITGWTTLGTLDQLSTNATPSHLRMQKTTTGGFSLYGIYKAAPSMPFTVTCKVSDMSWSASYQRAGLILLEAGGSNKILDFGYLYAAGNANVGYGLWSNRTTRSTWGGDRALIGRGVPVYLRFVVTSSTNIATYYSHGGLKFIAVDSGINPGFTVANVGLEITGEDNSVDVEAYFDWVRFS